jgi:RHS repeat-associated protein
VQNISKNGYLYIYVSNESPQNVYFDNVTVKQITGPLQQEQSYYPHGLPMAGISDKQLLKQITPYKANGGTELEEDYGLEYYNTQYRKYDVQTGRFNGVDALSEQTAQYTPYHFGGNNPVIFADPTGLRQRRPDDVAEGNSLMHQFNYNSLAAGFNAIDQIAGGGNQSSGGGGATNAFTVTGAGDVFLSGSYARAFLSAYENPFDNSNWSFSFGVNSKGETGFWQRSVFVGNWSESTSTGDNPTTSGSFGSMGTELRFVPVNSESGNVEQSSESEGTNWHGVVSASLNIVGGLAEWVSATAAEGGSGGTASPLAIPLYIDGAARITSNFTRLVGYFSGANEFAEAMPTSIGAAIGKIGDMAAGNSFYQYGYGQAIGGSINDLASFVVTGGSIQALSDVIENPTFVNGLFYAGAIIGYPLSQYDNFIGLKH